MLRDAALVLLRGSVDVGGARLGEHRDGALEPGLALLIESFLTRRQLHACDMLAKRGANALRDQACHVALAFQDLLGLAGHSKLVLRDL